MLLLWMLMLGSGPEFEITHSLKTPQTGRLLLMLSQDFSEDPRFQITDGLNAQLIFGMNVSDWDGSPLIFDPHAPGYPIAELSDVPLGTYNVQVLLNRYHLFKLENGKQVWLPPDRGEGQQWHSKPGNIYNEPIRLDLSDPTVTIKLDREIEPISPPQETRYHKYVKIRSERLSKFWGEDVSLAAWVLIPHGFDAHPDTKFPLMVFHGHFPASPWGLRSVPPDPDLKADYSERFGIHGYNKIIQEESYRFFNQWTSAEFPRFLVMEIQHPTPYYDDSYAVNSACQGPYGDAIVYELIPHVEKMFRGIGEGWARFLYGGSTGGWEAMATQVFYPDEFNGAFIACPDPIDFRAFMTINLYEDKNAYFYEGTFKKVPRPGHRDCLGHVSASIRDQNQLEWVLGDHSRSGGQFDIWEATYSPMNDDGYPKPIWNKETGDIDPEVAAYWRDHYDLTHIIQRDWKVIGERLRGKLHIYVGDMDNYYLNNAVYLTEAVLERLDQPKYEGEVAYGDREEHCWNGDPDNPNYLTRLRYNTLYLPKILKRIEISAPDHADLTSWRYAE
ncbi:MAG: hypothetical protein KDC35_00735 [Acidobacteria bacterium]|nr:hypothetical protein [Acidobacteriota bacterium]